NNFLPIFLVRRGIIELDARQAQPAETDADRARRLLELAAEPGTSSSTLGQAYLILGRALEAQGRNGEAHAAFQSGTENLQKSVGPDHPDTKIASRLAASPQ